VRAAVTSNPQALQYAAPALRANKAVVMEAVRSAGLFDSTDLLQYASPALRRDPEVIQTENVVFLRRWSSWNQILVTGLLLIWICCVLLGWLWPTGRFLARMDSVSNACQSLLVLVLFISGSGWCVAYLISSPHPG
ncbi:unnamed protein product, partial [Polarella glacialis]